MPVTQMTTSTGFGEVGADGGTKSATTEPVEDSEVEKRSTQNRSSSRVLLPLSAGVGMKLTWFKKVNVIERVCMGRRKRDLHRLILRQGSSHRTEEGSVAVGRSFQRAALFVCGVRVW